MGVKGNMEPRPGEDQLRHNDSALEPEGEYPTQKKRSVATMTLTFYCLDLRGQAEENKSKNW